MRLLAVGPLLLSGQRSRKNGIKGKKKDEIRAACCDRVTHAEIIVEDPPLREQWVTAVRLPRIRSALNLKFMFSGGNPH